MPQYSPNDLQNRDIAIRTIIGEDPSDQGAVGVAAVLLNRLAAGTYGNSIDDVVLAKDQFEAWPRQKEDLLRISTTDPRYVKIGRILDGLASGQIPDPTNGATHFYGPTSQAELGRQPPEWGRSGGQKLGGSLFFAPQGRVSYQRKFGAPEKYARPDWMAPTGNTNTDIDALVARVTGMPQTKEFPRPDWMAPLPEPVHDRPGMPAGSGLVQPPLHDRPPLPQAPLHDRPPLPQAPLHDRPAVPGGGRLLGTPSAMGAFDPGKGADVALQKFGMSLPAAPAASHETFQDVTKAPGGLRSIAQDPKVPIAARAMAGLPVVIGDELAAPFEWTQRVARSHDPLSQESIEGSFDAASFASTGEAGATLPRATKHHGPRVFITDAATEGPKAVEEALRSSAVLSERPPWALPEGWDRNLDPAKDKDSIESLKAQDDYGKAAVNYKGKTYWGEEHADALDKIVRELGKSAIPELDEDAHNGNLIFGRMGNRGEFRPYDGPVNDPGTIGERYDRDRSKIAASTPKWPSEPAKGPSEPPIAAPTPPEEFPRPDWMAPKDEATDAQPGSLSAAQSPPPAPLPARPTKQTVREAEESFGRLRGERTADQAKWDNYVQAMPAELRTPEMDELFYRYSEGDPTAVLTPERKLLWDKYAAPLKKHELASFEEAEKTDLDVAEYDPTYVHRIPKGSHPAFDRLTGDAQTADPVMGQGRLPKSTSSMNPRVFHAIQSNDGDRLLVARDDDGNLRVILKGQPAYPLRLNDPIKKGESFHASIMSEEPAKLWTLTDAHTSEIERETDIQYHKSFFGNTIDNIEKLDAVNRAVAETRRLLNSPEWAAYAMPYGEWMDKMRDPAFKNGPMKDWIVPKMPTFWGYRVDPKLAHVIDDFYGREPLLKALSGVNRAVIGTMFWSPFTHGVNAASHWTTARGWDWVKGPGLKSVFVDGARAAVEVVTLGPKYQELLRNGSGMVYGRVVEARHYERVMRALGYDIVHNPSKWGPVADALGVSVTFLPRMIYGASSRALWAFSDILMMQRVLELERKGMDLRTAISETEHHIPPYKTRSEILGSRTAAVIYQDPTLFQFSRYHIGALESHAHMARAMIEGGKTPLNESKRIEALGNYMAIAFGVVIFNPGINWIIQETTGNKDTKWMPRGSTTIPSTLVDKGVHALAGTEWGKKHVPKFWADYYNGNSSWVIALENLVPFAPFVRGGIEALNDRLNFSGQTIVEPADAAHMRIWRMIGQGAGYLGEQMFQPMDAAMRAWRGAKPGENVAGKVARQVFEGGLNVSEPNVEGQKKVQTYQEKQATARAKKPRDVLEEVGLWMDTHMPWWFGGSAH